jgi:tRNA(Arg) A34 adenosine deaminase TadA
MTSAGGFATDADRAVLQRAVDLATQNVAAGGGPFAALVVSADGTVIGEGTNRVTRDLDPSAHAEVVAIRAACQTIRDFALRGATLYTSCEPCPMCMATALWARIDRVFYAADRDDAVLRPVHPRPQYLGRASAHPPAARCRATVRRLAGIGDAHRLLNPHPLVDPGGRGQLPRYVV